MGKFISVVIPNYNRSSAIGKCLEAAFSSDYTQFEVIVVDDCSSDASIKIISKYPCKLISLDKRSGASKARNTGAKNSSGEIIFFMDSDCLLQPDTLYNVNKAVSEQDSENTVIGGTYTLSPYDSDFFSSFQSVFINYSETKKIEPDYIASHAMVINRGLFLRSGGFPEVFLPIIEDVEFSHRLRKSGCKLVMSPSILVQHIFDFSFSKSLKNAFRKSKYWTCYSINNKDLLKDSGTASAELKMNVASLFFSTSLILMSFFLSKPLISLPAALIISANMLHSRGIFHAFSRTGDLLFALKATLYYLFLYPIPVGIGAIAGTLKLLLTQYSPSLEKRG